MRKPSKRWHFWLTWSKLRKNVLKQFLLSPASFSPLSFHVVNYFCIIKSSGGAKILSLWGISEVSHWRTEVFRVRCHLGLFPSVCSSSYGTREALISSAVCLSRGVQKLLSRLGDGCLSSALVVMRLTSWVAQNQRIFHLQLFQLWSKLWNRNLLKYIIFLLSKHCCRFLALLCVPSAVLCFANG